MPKYLLQESDKFIGYDDVTGKVKIYKPQDTTLLSLTEQELKEMMKLIRLHPEGGSMKAEDLDKTP
jgi:hypothetical protein